MTQKSIRELAARPARLVRSWIRWQRAAATNARKAPPIFPVSAATHPNGLKVHVGAGEINLQGWINVDARPFGHIHSRTTSLALDEFTDGAIAAIYMCHVLEHLSFDESLALLKAFQRKLCSGGVLLLSVPDFDALVRIYGASNNDLETIKHALMGGQGYEYNFHKSVYNRAALEKLLGDAGFRDISLWRTEDEFGQQIGDWSSAAAVVHGGQRIPISLNLRGVRV